MSKLLSSKFFNKLIILLIFIILSISNINESKSFIYCELLIKISELSSNMGNVRVHLYDLSGKDAFPTKSEEAFRLTIGKISNKTAQVKFSPIPPGYYAITVHHDENLNIKMDRTILGFPAEGWGVSNNIKPIMRIPNFDECKFFVAFGSTVISIKMNN